MIVRGVPYAIQYVFLRAVLENYTGTDRAIMDATVPTFAAAFLRVSNSMGRPDMRARDCDK